ncbi:MAG TPA: PQQ-dependent sugar dehydrogenase [Longimicrobiales bacterium]|nr:PQQ-dependent sugar dehydrogenase [Longimicrobiales bacterium]
MHRFRLPLAAATLLLAAQPAWSQVERTDLEDYRIVTVAEGLEHPWGMAFLPNGDLLVTERPGRLRIIRDGRLLPDPVPGVPEVFARGQGGLLGLTLHPDFASNRTLYLAYSKPLPGDASTTAVIRGRFENDRLTGVEEVFEANSRGNGHYGSRLAFDDDGYLFFSVGDRQAPPRGDLEAHPAQDRSNHHGTINRIEDDGGIPGDNPFVGQAGIEPSIWSYGHRNPQGLTFHPSTGDLWITEHGPQGGDELNRVQPGLNYGWPVVGYGVNYGSGAAIHEGTMRDGMENPVHFWVPSIGTSGLMVYTGDAFPEWQGDLFAGGLSGARIDRLELDGQSVSFEETILHGQGRVRDIVQGPDGFIYVAIDDRQGNPTPILRLEPAR